MLVLSIVFMALTLLSPADLIPGLAAFRPMMVITLTGLVAAMMASLLDPDLFKSRQAVLMVFFFGMILASQPMHGWFGGALYSGVSFGASFVIFFLILCCIDKPSRLYWFAAFVVLVALYYVARTTAAIHWGVDAEKFLVWEWTDKMDMDTGLPIKEPRIIGLGVLSDPNDLGQLMLFSIALLSMAFYKAPILQKLLVAPVVLLLFYDIYLTKSRGTVVGMAALIVAIMHNRLGKMGPIVGAGLTGLMVLGLGFGGGRGFSSQTGSGAERLKMWSETLALIKSAPLRGIGHNNAFEYLWNTTHNSYLLCFVELGIFGYLIWMGVLVATFLQLRQVMALKDRGPDGFKVARIARALYFAFVAMAVSSFFLSRAYAFIIYVLLGLSAAVWRIAQKKFPEMEPLPWPKLAQYSVVTAMGVVVLIYVMVRFHWA